MKGGSSINRRAGRFTDLALAVADEAAGATSSTQFGLAICERCVELGLYEFARLGEYEDGEVVSTSRSGDDGGLSVADADISEREAMRNDTVQVATLRKADGGAGGGDMRGCTSDESGCGDDRACAIVPLNADSEHRGVLVLHATHAGAFDERERSFLADLGDTVATVLAAAEDHTPPARGSSPYRLSAEEVLDTLDDVFYAFDEQGNFIRWNESFSSVTGYDDGEIAAMHPLEFVPDGEEEKIAEGIEQTLSEGFAQVESYFETKGGECIPYEFTGSRLTDTEGNVIGLVGVGRDISERREMEAAVRETSQRLDAVIEASPLPVLVLDRAAEVQLWNPAAEELFGYTSDEAVGGPPPMIPSERRERNIGLLKRALDGEVLTGVELCHHTRDGAPVEVSLNTAPIRDAPGEIEGVVAILANVTEQRERRRKLRELQAAARELLRAESETEVGDIAVRTARDVLDCPVTGLWLYDRVADALEPRAWTDEAKQLLADIPTFAAGEGLAWEVFESGDPGQYENVPDEEGVYNPETPIRAEVILPLGEHGVLMTGTTERAEFDNADVEMLRVFAANVEAALDRSDRERVLRQKERELRRQNDQLEFLNALLRHEVLNGTMVITTYAEILEAHVDDAGEEYLSTIAEYGKDIADLIEKVRAVLQTLTAEDREFRRVSLRPVLTDRIERLRATFPEANVTADVADIAVWADDLLGDVLWNVLVNAVEHNDADEPRVWVTAEECDGSAVVQIADNGPGVPDDRKEVVFERDSVQGGPPGGAGFGLYFVVTMLDHYGGTAHVEDRDGGGAVFVVEIPLADADFDFGTGPTG